MKILLLNNEYPPIGGGGSTVCKYAAEYLANHGHEVHIITTQYGSLPQEENVNGVNVHRVSAIRRFKDYSSWWELLTYVWSAFFSSLTFIRKQHPDIIQAFFAVPAGGIAWALTRFYRRIPYIVYLGGSDVPGANPSRFKRLYPFLTPIVRVILRGAYAVTACAYRIRDLANKVYPHQRMMFIPNGAETRRFVPSDVREGNTKVIILGVGRLIPRKGYQFVIEALPKIRTLTKEPFVLRLVGSGEYKKDLDRLASRYEVSELLEYAGHISYDALLGEYQRANIFVMPSLSEGMPCALIEAMATGLPAVVTDVSGNDELVRNGENGFRYQVDALGSSADIHALAKHLAFLISHAVERKKMGNRATEIARQYDWEKIAHGYEQLYRNALHHVA